VTRMEDWCGKEKKNLKSCSRPREIKARAACNERAKWKVVAGPKHGAVREEEAMRINEKAGGASVRRS
jgi:hypothetical protein